MIDVSKPIRKKSSKMPARYVKLDGERGHLVAWQYDAVDVNETKRQWTAATYHTLNAVDEAFENEPPKPRRVFMNEYVTTSALGAACPVLGECAYPSIMKCDQRARIVEFKEVIRDDNGNEIL